MVNDLLKFTLLKISVWMGVLSLTLGVYLPGLSGGFLFDDNSNIVENEAVQIKELSTESLLSSLNGPNAGPLGRPVSVASFALNHSFSGLDPFAFKATNLAIHLFNGLLIAWLANLLIRRLMPDQLNNSTLRWLPIWVAAAWLLHPINTIPVLLAVQRMTLLATLFMLLAIILHLKALALPAKSCQQILLLGLAWLICWPFAVLSKETGLLLPLFLLVIGWISPTRQVQQTSHLRFAFYLGLLSLIVLAMLFLLGTSWLAGAYSMRDFDMTERLMTEIRVLWFYLGQILLPEPDNFALFHDDITISRGLLRPWTTLAALSGWVVALAGLLFYRRRYPLPCFAAAWFLAGHSLESSILPLEIAHEYRNYLPAFGVIFVVGAQSALKLQTLRIDHPRMTLPLVACIPLFVLALFTWIRADQLGKPVTGLLIEASQHPQSARANYSAAVSLIQAGHGDIGDPIGAISVRYHLEQSINADPAFKLGHLGLILWACATGRPAEASWISDYSLRLRHSPFAPADLGLPGQILKPLLSMPSCLARQDVVRLLTAGAENSKLDPSVRSDFLEALADYELLVSHDPNSAAELLTQAMRYTPLREALKKKLQGLQRGTM